MMCRLAHPEDKEDAKACVPDQTGSILYELSLFIPLSWTIARPGNVIYAICKCQQCWNPHWAIHQKVPVMTHTTTSSCIHSATQCLTQCTHTQILFALNHNTNNNAYNTVNVTHHAYKQTQLIFILNGQTVFEKRRILVSIAPWRATQHITHHHTTQKWRVHTQSRAHSASLLLLFQIGQWACRPTQMSQGLTHTGVWPTMNWSQNWEVITTDKCNNTTMGGSYSRISVLFWIIHACPIHHHHTIRMHTLPESIISYIWTMMTSSYRESVECVRISDRSFKHPPQTSLDLVITLEWVNNRSYRNTVFARGMDSDVVIQPGIASTYQHIR